ncbi:hypothetical protein [Desulfurococcus mucosus]|uniref:Uncharacterized protein n=1 Tax=Desulfurococcus mucosus (strain ATCC 35584 / DSM 2162 / JCM 9187 / O7/1) TaxID=765177 RepID=E8R8A3_DESM0|nr:hypothetical protein [Desulfurococcus mucosus]ADV64729.1 hypothetical protein Desmu_0410 [Desulfurococcus mucosus DSM 2162]
MPGRLYSFIVLYTGLVAASNTWLLLLGEKRADAYLAVNTLIYFTLYSTMRPMPPGSRRARALTLLLLAVFTTIVAYRVYRVLNP